MVFRMLGKKYNICFKEELFALLYQTCIYLVGMLAVFIGMFFFSNQVFCQEIDSLDLKYGMGYRDYLEPMDSNIVDHVLNISLKGNCDTIVGFLRRDDGIGEPNGFNGFSGIMKFHLTRRLISCNICIQEMIENNYVYGSKFSIDAEGIELNNRPVFYALTGNKNSLNVLKRFLLYSNYLVMEEKYESIIIEIANARLFFLVLDEISDEEYGELNKDRRLYLKSKMAEIENILRKIKNK